MRKIFRSLSVTWIHKVSTIEESKDLKKYNLEELIRSLMTHEIHIQSLQNKSDFKKKGLALKATEEDLNNDESSSSSNEDSLDIDELAMLSKRVQILMKLRKKVKKLMKNNKEPTCYNCGKSGHFKADCFKKTKDDKLKKKDANKGKKKKFYSKKGKRATLSDLFRL